MRQAGAAVPSPLTLLREYHAALQQIARRPSRLSTEGRFVPVSMMCDWIGFRAQPVPVLIGGTGPKTLRLAGEIADGVIVDSLNTPDSASGIVRSRRCRTGRPRDSARGVRDGAVPGVRTRCRRAATSSTTRR